MKKLILALGFLSSPCLFAHNVFPLSNTINLSEQGPVDQDVIVQHFTGEACIVTASLAVINQSSNPLIQVLLPNGSSGLDVTFNVFTVRPPSGTRESVELKGAWQATGTNTEWPAGKRLRWRRNNRHNCFRVCESGAHTDHLRLHSQSRYPDRSRVGSHRGTFRLR